MLPGSPTEALAMSQVPIAQSECHRSYIVQEEGDSEDDEDFSANSE